MAKTYPRELPTYIREDPVRSAECRVYDALREDLSERYAVFYSRPWLGTAPDGQEIDGEADFVIAHAERGILTLEVKGGEIRRDAETEDWFSRDRHGITHRIKNPVMQARQSKYEILKKLADVQFWRPRFIRASYGVVFPDCANPGTALGADMPLEIFAFAEDMPRLGHWVVERMKLLESQSHKTYQPLGKDGLGALRHLLARSFELRMPLSSAFEVEDREIVLLTEQQYHVLDYLSRTRRSVIEGGAGSGKTLLAVELAGRLARTGSRTLLTCYNRPLGEHLKRRVDQAPGIVIRSFHELCGLMASQSGIELPDDAGEQKTDFYGHRLVDVMVEAVAENRSLRFDAIVVDEGQDFHPEWIAALELCLADEERGHFYVFYDNNQRLYSLPAEKFALPGPAFPLTRNLRNSRQIFQLTRVFYWGDSYTGVGPHGQEVEWVPAAGSDMASELMKVLGRLTKTERVAPDQIAILATERQTISDELLQQLKRGYRLSDAERPESGAIIVDTIRRFKGLESRVVIVLASAQLLDEPELAYVGFSRARLYLVVLGEREILDSLKAHEAQRLVDRGTDPVTE